MTNTTRSILALLFLSTGCHLDGSLKYDCKTSADCNTGNICDNGVCIAADIAGDGGTGAITPTVGTLAPVVTVAPNGPDGGSTATGADMGSSLPMECTEAVIDSYEDWIYASSLVGTWVGCDTVDLFGDPDQVGIEFAANGQFYLLESHGDGLPTRATDPAYTGGYDTTNTAGESDAQLTLTFPSGAIVAQLSGDQLPARVHIALGGKVATLVGVPLVRPSSCDAAPTGVALPSTKDAQSFWALAQGRWAFCNGYNGLGSAGGIELVRGGASGEDGTYYNLYPDATGTSLVRGTSPGDIGGISLDFFDGKTQINFDSTEGSLGTFLDFYSGVNDMVIDGGGGGPRFVRIE